MMISPAARDTAIFRFSPSVTRGDTECFTRGTDKPRGKDGSIRSSTMINSRREYVCSLNIRTASAAHRCRPRVGMMQETNGSEGINCLQPHNHRLKAVLHD